MKAKDSLLSSPTYAASNPQFCLEYQKDYYINRDTVWAEVTVTFRCISRYISCILRSRWEEVNLST